MGEFIFEKMDKTQTKLSVAIYGPSGAGKTTGALKLAKGIQEQLYPDEKLEDIGLFVDTERRSSTKVVGRSIGGEVLNPLELYVFEPPFDIYKLADLVDYAVNVKHKKIIIIDSYTAFWSGVDGILDRVAELDVELGAAKKLYGAWSEKEIVKKKNVLKNLMTNADCHMIICFRAKTEYVLETNSHGKTTPRAVGLKEDMQADVRYEFDAVISIDKETHEAEVVKDRIGFYEIRETSSNPTSPLTVEDGKCLARLASEGLSLEEVVKRKTETMIKYILDAKSHNSGIVKALEAKLKVEFTPDVVKKFSYDNLLKIVKALQ
jgi:GTPase SAR1 family protein